MKIYETSRENLDVDIDFAIDIIHGLVTRLEEYTACFSGDKMLHTCHSLPQRLTQLAILGHCAPMQLNNIVTIVILWKP